MAQIRSEVYKAVSENNINEVVFQDPLGDESRKAKRNLVASSFGTILIAALDLQVNGFLGLQTSTGATIGAAITRGLACLVVLYFFAGFLVSAYVDYSAWKFRRERYLITPYLELIRMMEGHFSVLSEQINNATLRLQGLSSEPDMRTQIEASRAIADAQGQLRSISENSTAFREEVRPLLGHWADTVQKTSRLTWRLRTRFLSFWALDLLLPVGLALYAIWRTATDLCVVFARIAS